MLDIKKTKIQIFNGKNCPDFSGCNLIFDPKTNHQYLPLKDENYLFTLEGNISFKFADNTVINSSLIYSSNEWLDYQDIWKYGVSVESRLQNGSVFVRLTPPINKAECSLQIKTIQNESVSIQTDENSFLIVYGRNYTYNDVLYSPTNDYLINFKSDTNTHELVASSPITLMLLKKI